MVCGNTLLLKQLHRFDQQWLIQQQQQLGCQQLSMKRSSRRQGRGTPSSSSSRSQGRALRSVAGKQSMQLLLRTAATGGGSSQSQPQQQQQQ
jgi:hypothetical protein